MLTLTTLSSCVLCFMLPSTCGDCEWCLVHLRHQQATGRRRNWDLTLSVTFIFVRATSPLCPWQDHRHGQGHQHWADGGRLWEHGPLHHQHGGCGRHVERHRLPVRWRLHSYDDIIFLICPVICIGKLKLHCNVFSGETYFCCRWGWGRRQWWSSWRPDQLTWSEWWIREMLTYF